MKVLKTVFFKCPKCGQESMCSIHPNPYHKINVIGDEACLRGDCSHDNCTEGSYDYLCKRCNNALFNIRKHVEADYLDIKENYDLRRLYDTMYELLSDVEFIDFVDDSDFINLTFNSFSFSHFRKLENFIIRMIKEKHSKKEIFEILDYNFKKIDTSASIKTVRNLRKRNSRLLDELIGECFAELQDDDETPFYALIQIFRMHVADTQIGDFTLPDKLSDDLSDAANAFRDAATENKQLSRETRQFIQQLQPLLNNADSTFHDIRVAAKTVGSTSVDVRSNVDMIGEASRSFEDLILSNQDKIKELLTTSAKTTGNIETVNSIFDNAKKHWDGIIANLIVCYQSESFTTISASIYSICSMLGLSRSIANKFLDYTGFNAKAQFGTSTMKLVAMISTILGKENPLKKLTTLNIASIAKEMQGTEFIMKTLEGAMSELGIYQSEAMKSHTLVKKDIAELLKNLIIYETELALTPMKLINRQHFNAFDVHCKQANFLKSQYLDDRTMPIADLNMLAVRFNKIATEIEEIKAMCGRRCEPAMFVLQGAKGIGKTELMLAMVNNTQNHDSLLVERLKSLKWDTNDEWINLGFKDWNVWSESNDPNMEFQEGYKGQEMHILDDYGQDSSDNEHLKIFRYVSSSPLITNQAALHEKGRRYEARLIMASINKFPTQSKTVNDIDAFHRRHRVIEVKQKQGMNVSNDSTTIDRSFSHLTFRYWPSGIDYVANDTTKCKTMNLDDLLKVILETILCKDRYWRSCAGIQASNDWETMPSYNDYLDASARASRVPQSWKSSSFNGCYVSKDINKAFRSLKMNVTVNDEDQAYLLGDYSGKHLEWENTDFVFNHFDEIEVTSWFVTKVRQLGGLRFENRSRAWAILPDSKGGVRLITYAFRDGDEPKYLDNDEDAFTETSWNAYRHRVARWYSKLFPNSYVIRNLLGYIFMGWNAFISFITLPITLPVIIIAHFMGIRAGSIDSLELYAKCHDVMLLLSSLVLLYLLFKVIKSWRLNKKDCEICDATDLREELNCLLQEKCKAQCKLGILYSKHTEECQQRVMLLDGFIAQLCNCKDSGCECLHSVIEFDERSSEFVKEMLESNELNDDVRMRLNSFFSTIESSCACTEMSKCVKHTIEEHQAKYQHDGFYFPLQWKYVKGKIVQEHYGNFTDFYPYAKAFRAQKNLTYMLPVRAYYPPDRDNIMTLHLTPNSAIYFVYHNYFDEAIAYLVSGTNNDVEIFKEALKTRKVIRPEDIKSDFKLKYVHLPSDIVVFPQMQDSKLEACKIAEVFRYFFPPKEDELSPDDYTWTPLYDGGEALIRKPDTECIESSPLAMKKPKVRRQDQGILEYKTDPICFDQLNTVIGCMVKVVREHEASLWGIGMGGFVIVPAHIISENKNTKYHMIRKNVEGEEETIPLQVHDYDRSIEMGAFTFNVNKYAKFSLKAFKTIPSKEELLRFVPLAEEAYQYVASDKCKYGLKVEIMYSHSYKWDSTGYHKFDEVISARSLCAKGAPTENGDCGSPIVVSCKKMQRKFVGMHFLSAEGCSINLLVCKDHLVKVGVISSIADTELNTAIAALQCAIISKAKFPIYDVMDLITAEKERPKIKGQNLQYLGDVAHIVNPSTTTSYQKHILHGAFPEKEIPSALHVNDVEDQSLLLENNHGDKSLIWTAFSKYDDDTINNVQFEEFLKEAEDQLVDYLEPYFIGSNLAPLGEIDTLSGIATDVFSKSVEPNTASGYPWSYLFGSSGLKKKNFLLEFIRETGDKGYMIDKGSKRGAQLYAEIHRKLYYAAEGKRTLSPWKNCLKDEPRPIDKVKVGNTRLFTAPPFETLFLMKSFFDPFKVVWSKNRIELFHGVTINPVSSEWNILRSRFEAMGQLCQDADFKNFDTKQQANVMRFVGKVIRRIILNNSEYADVYDIPREFIAEYHELILEVLWEEIVETVHLTEDECHLTFHGNPSGNPMTTPLNCFVNFVYHWYAFMRLVGFVSLVTFISLVFIITFGDDVCYSTNCVEYNGDAIAKIFAEIGQTYTPSEKVGTFVWKSVDEIRFLQRHFKKDGSHVFAPIRHDSIEQQFNWTQIMGNDYITINACLQEASIESVMHGKKYFQLFNDTIRKKISTLSSDQQIKIRYNTNFADNYLMLLKRISDLKISRCF